MVHELRALASKRAPVAPTSRGCVQNTNREIRKAKRQHVRSTMELSSGEFSGAMLVDISGQHSI